MGFKKGLYYFLGTLLKIRKMTNNSPTLAQHSPTGRCPEKDAPRPTTKGREHHLVKLPVQNNLFKLTI